MPKSGLPLGEQESNRKGHGVQDHQQKNYRNHCISIDIVGRVWDVPRIWNILLRLLEQLD
jgi:hypothetical protein